ncbi:hypothetical protein BDV59DRAFT_169324 [Aspergillus ambiguus]|uniref:uncharacterized protein n=1 Tax=Aspergillus ambiguus TaxID=176160 RepID=UPI003CCC8FE1
MAWFPSQLGADEQGWKFDIVSLLAVIGGSTIEKHKQVITASRLGVIPRLLPAPDTLLNTDRPLRLPSVKDVTVYGVYSGTHTNELNFFANLIHEDIESLQQYEFRTYCITYRDENMDMGKTEEGAEDKDVYIPVRTISKLNFVTVISILMTIGLFIWAGVIHDGVALIGLVSMSLSTSAACLSSQWRPKLPKRRPGGAVPLGDVVIKTRGGAFVVVHCKEEITRELYLGMDVCEYVYEGTRHQLLLASSTILLMGAIIFFSNCGRTMQIAVGVAYIILNILYWLIALLPSTQHETWDLDRYKIEELPKQEPQPQIFTEALWYAIRETKDIEWVKKARLAPDTKHWDGWLQEALDNCEDAHWDAVAAKNRWMSLAAEEKRERERGKREEEEAKRE